MRRLEACEVWRCASPSRAVSSSSSSISLPKIPERLGHGGPQPGGSSCKKKDTETNPNGRGALARFPAKANSNLGTTGISLDAMVVYFCYLSHFLISSDRQAHEGGGGDGAGKKGGIPSCIALGALNPSQHARQQDRHRSLPGPAVQIVPASRSIKNEDTHPGAPNAGPVSANSNAKHKPAPVDLLGPAAEGAAATPACQPAGALASPRSSPFPSCSPECLPPPSWPPPPPLRALLPR